MWRVQPLVVSDEDRAELERRVRAHTTSQRDRVRAEVVLASADGVAGRQISARLGLSPQAVCKWRRRFLALGLDGLVDAPRPGRPATFGPTEHLVLLAKATEERPEVSSHWSHRDLARAMGEAGIEISESQVGRILAAKDVKPHRVESWLTRKDSPEFWDRAEDVCGLYLSPPTNAVVLSVDEKTAVPARSRTHPTVPVAPGRIERQEFEYRRHGTACLMAALDVATGQVLARDVPKNSAEHFITFLDEIEQVINPALAIHLVLDNGASHVAKATTAWLADHPRFVVHHTPKHASWLNQVEAFFSILTRKLLKRGEFESRDDLVAKVMAFIADYDQRATPFAWTYDAKRKAA